MGSSGASIARSRATPTCLPPSGDSKAKCRTSTSARTQRLRSSAAVSSQCFLCRAGNTIQHVPRTPSEFGGNTVSSLSSNGTLAEISWGRHRRRRAADGSDFPSGLSSRIMIRTRSYRSLAAIMPVIVMRSAPGAAMRGARLDGMLANVSRAPFLLVGGILINEGPLSTFRTINFTNWRVLTRCNIKPIICT